MMSKSGYFFREEWRQTTKRNSSDAQLAFRRDDNQVVVIGNDTLSSQFIEDVLSIRTAYVTRRHLASSSDGPTAKFVNVSSVLGEIPFTERK